MDDSFWKWWKSIGSILFLGSNKSFLDVAEAAFQYGRISGKRENTKPKHFYLSSGFEEEFWRLHTAALSYGKTPDEQADSHACKERLERLKAAAFQYREAYDKFHAPDEIVLYYDSSNNYAVGVKVWGYIKDGKQTITRTEIVK